MGLLEMVFGGGLGTINGSDSCVQKDTQLWDGKTYLRLGLSQTLSTGTEVQAGCCGLNSYFWSTEPSPCANASLSILLHIMLCSDA